MTRNDQRTVNYVLQCQDAWMYAYKMRQRYALPCFANRISLKDWLAIPQAQRQADRKAQQAQMRTWKYVIKHQGGIA